MPTHPAPRELTTTSHGATLAADLTVPDRDTAVPGVVMVGGSGPSDRTNADYFTAIRDHLVAAGIAVLSYDKRGVGASTGDWRASTIDDLATDALAALAALRADPGVHTDRVGLFGHSEGGWVVLRAAARDGKLPWVITNSGPGTTPAVQDRHALGAALASAGTTRSADADAEAALALYDRLVEAGRRGANFAEATRLVDEAGRPPGFADYWAEIVDHGWEFLTRKHDHDPIPDVRRLRCPHLALFGGADPLVPVPASIAAFTAVACEPDRDCHAILRTVVFPGADHRVQLDGGKRLAPGYSRTLTEWITGERATDQLSRS
ncbi:MAG TPA: alpha/beta hydrolase [Pseudonocardiaceae bacterium]|nr:alpha/beta hydrolase [Pseudonocardiaceae bacterium]